MGWVSGRVCGMSSIGFSLALTSFFIKDGLHLYAITGGVGNISLSVLFCWTGFQCCFIICLSLWASSQNWVTKINFGV